MYISSFQDAFTIYELYMLREYIHIERGEIERERQRERGRKIEGEREREERGVGERGIERGSEIE